MNYYLFKLQFSTPVHFGSSDSALSLYTSDDHFCADTLFSALCHTANSLYGSAGAQTLCAYAQEHKLCLSDSMPWYEDTLFLPKPYVAAEHHQELPAHLRIKVKNLKWIEVSSFEQFAESVKGGEVYLPNQLKFGVHAEQAKVNLTGEVPLPYQIGIYQFHPGCGLYILAGCESDSIAQQLRKLMEALGLTGIGGKVTSGYGKFTVLEMIDLSQSDQEQLRWLNCALEKKAGRQLLLTTSLPADTELEQAMEGATYHLVRRGGFANANGDSIRKKQTQYYLAAGSLLMTQFQGDLYCVCQGADYPVLRYSVPMFLGVKL